MTKSGRSKRILRWSMASILGVGTLAQLGGCDPTVRTVFLGGLETATETLTDTFVSAFFLSLADDDATGDSLTGT